MKTMENPFKNYTPPDADSILKPGLEAELKTFQYEINAIREAVIERLSDDEFFESILSGDYELVVGYETSKLAALRFISTLEALTQISQVLFKAFSQAADNLTIEPDKHLLGLGIKTTEETEPKVVFSLFMVDENEPQNS